MRRRSWSAVFLPLDRPQQKAGQQAPVKDRDLGPGIPESMRAEYGGQACLDIADKPFDRLIAQVLDGERFLHAAVVFGWTVFRLTCSDRISGVKRMQTFRFPDHSFTNGIARAAILS